MIRKIIDLVRRAWSNTAGLIRRLWAIQVLRFLLVGGVNTAFGYGVFALLILINSHLKLYSQDVELVLAPLMSQICGVLFNFKTTGVIVFRNKNNRLILRFFGVYLSTYLLNVGFLHILESHGLRRLVAGAIVVLPLSLLAYWLNKRFVFNPPGRSSSPAGQSLRREP